MRDAIVTQYPSRFNLKMVFPSPRSSFYFFRFLHFTLNGLDWIRLAYSHKSMRWLVQVFCYSTYLFIRILPDIIVKIDGFILQWLFNSHDTRQHTHTEHISVFSCCKQNKSFVAPFWLMKANVVYFRCCGLLENKYVGWSDIYIYAFCVEFKMFKNWICIFENMKKRSCIYRAPINALKLLISARHLLSIHKQEAGVWLETSLQC